VLQRALDKTKNASSLAWGNWQEKIVGEGKRGDEFGRKNEPILRKECRGKTNDCPRIERNAKCEEIAWRYHQGKSTKPQKTLWHTGDWGRQNSLAASHHDAQGQTTGFPVRKR